MSSLRKVRPGDSVRGLSASDWNAFIDATQFVERLRNGGGAPDPRASQQPTVKVKNSAGADVGMGAILRIGAPLFGPSDNLPEFRMRTSFAGTIPAADTAGRIGVTVEPIASGKIGRVALNGLVVCKVDVTDPSTDRASELAGQHDRLVTNNSGNARILWRESGTSGQKWAAVLLNSPQSSSSGTWLIVGSTYYTATTPKRYKYQLKRGTKNTTTGLYTVDSSSQLVYAHNLFEDSTTAWGNGQPMTLANGATLSVSGPCVGPVAAYFSGYFDAGDGTPLYDFYAVTPMGTAC
ncbi:MAG: hypothetical protein PSV22_14390 [Pseudolabrys sp.]|nr:hypothetical protein [Pseudolabrys sp.]